MLALLIIVSGRARLLGTVTAFTLAHSITLTLATLGFVRVPFSPVEAVIALSILFLACEIVHARSGRPGLAASQSWIVAFAFGLLHGFGFAGALSELGVSENAIPLALLFFNLGVEVGQLLFVAATLSLFVLVRRLAPSWQKPNWSWQVPTDAIGALAAMWTIERVLAFWG